MSPSEQRRIIEASLQRLNQLRSAPADPIASLAIELQRPDYSRASARVALRCVVVMVERNAAAAARAQGDPLVYWRLRAKLLRIYWLHLARCIGGAPATSDAESLRSALQLPLQSAR